MQVGGKQEKEMSRASPERPMVFPGGSREEVCSVGIEGGNGRTAQPATAARKA